MGKGSHLLAENVGGCTSGQRFARPCRRNTGEAQLTFCVAWTALWLGFVADADVFGQWKDALGSFLLAVGSLLGFNLVGQRVDQDRSAEVDAALLLAQRAYWIYLACATGWYETREQRSSQKDRNHDRKSR